MTPDGTLARPLLEALARLDEALQGASAAGGAPPAPGTDPFRGLYVAEQDLDRLFAQGPGGLVVGALGPSSLMDLEAVPRWAQLATTFGLTPFDLNVLLLALAPALDLRYERIFAFLQDDVTRKRPTVDLAIGLGAHGFESRLTLLERFAPWAPLVEGNLIELVGEGAGPAPLLTRQLHLDDRMVAYLLGDSRPDARLRGALRAVSLRPGELEEAVPEALRRRLLALARRPDRGELAGCIQLVSPDRGVREAAAGLLAAGMDRRLLMADLARLAALESDPLEAVARVRREARLAPAFVLWEGADRLREDGEEARATTRLLELIGACGVPCALGSAGAEELPREAGALVTLTLELPAPTVASRTTAWRRHLRDDEASLPPGEVDRLATAFQLGHRGIEEAIRLARRLAAWRDPAESQLRREDLQQGARRQTGHLLRHVAARIIPQHGWDDLVLPDDQLAQLRELSLRLLHRQTVFERWGFERRLALGAGVHALFAGPSGTGKTLAAEIVAGELGLPLYRIDVSRIVSKYIGETEKNLHRVFAEATAARPILFFDEADALFGKRTEVKDAHDRYANIEVSYLLQAMEQYDGLTILATNLRQNMDDAIVRRLSFAITFPSPEEADRLRLWRLAWPAETPVDPELDVRFLARQFRLTGGNIRNIALAAAFAAAADGGMVTMTHVIRGVRRELQKLGKTCVESDFGAYFPLLGGAPAAAAVA